MSVRVATDFAARRKSVWDTVPTMEEWVLPLVLLAVVALEVAAFVVGLARWWLFAAGLPIGELRRLHKEFPDKAHEVVSTFYEWRQDTWNKLGRAAAAGALSLLLSVVAIVIQVATKTLEKDASGVVKTTETDFVLPTTVPTLAVGLVILSVAAWTHGLVLQRRMVRDIGRLVS